MHSFRMRLVLALIAGVTIVSVASTYFEVLAHKHLLRQELEQRSTWMGASLQPEIERTVTEGNTAALPALVERSRAQIGALGVGVYAPDGKLMASSGVPAVFQAIAQAPFKSLAKTPVQSLARTQVEKSIKRGTQVNSFGSTGETQWLEKVFPLHDGSQQEGALVILSGPGYIRDQH